MNPLVQEAAGAIQGAWLLGVMTAVFFAFFLGWVWYAYTPRNKDLMDEMAKMPLSDGGEG